MALLWEWSALLLCLSAQAPFILFLIFCDCLYHYPNTDKNIRLGLSLWVPITKVSINTKLVQITKLSLKIFSLDWEVIPILYPPQCPHSLFYFILSHLLSQYLYSFISESSVFSLLWRVNQLFTISQIVYTNPSKHSIDAAWFLFYRVCFH